MRQTTVAAGSQRRVLAAIAAVVVLAALLALVSLPSSGSAVQPPRGWPSTVVIGLQDPEHGAAALRQQAPLGLRYHYLSGGVNTGQGWQTFSGGDGAFVGQYVADSQANGYLTWFSYYMLLQSAPGDAQTDERLKTTVNLGSLPTMTAYYEDLKAFFQRAAATAVDPIVLHVEPDTWGYAQRTATGDDARTVPAQVASTGLPELSGLPNDVAGFAQAIVRLRDRYAPNVELAYPVSVWGTGVDISISDPPAAQIDALAARTIAFYRSLGARFDLLAFEFADRDAGYREVVDGGGRSGWWDLDDFHRNERYVADVTGALQKPGVMWQIPLGNTRMRAMDDTRGHYQDNRVQTLLDPSMTELKHYRDAGIVGLLFGNAVAGTTCACDATGDGVSNPLPTDGNGAPSLSADDDGGLFKALVAQYAARGGLPAAAAPPPPPMARAWARISLRASARPARARPGTLVRAIARVTSATAVTANVGIEIRGPGAEGRVVRRRPLRAQRLRAGKPRAFSLSWRVPRSARAGRYAVVVRAVQRRASKRRTTKSPAVTVTVRR